MFETGTKVTFVLNLATSNVSTWSSAFDLVTKGWYNIMCLRKGIIWPATHVTLWSSNMLKVRELAHEIRTFCPQKINLSGWGSGMMEVKPVHKWEPGLQLRNWCAVSSYVLVPQVIELQTTNRWWNSVCHDTGWIDGCLLGLVWEYGVLVWILQVNVLRRK